LNQGHQSGNRSHQKSQDIPFWEWVIAILGLVLVVGSIGFMVYEAMKENSPPNIVVRVDSILPVQNGYLVQIRAINQGGATVAGLMVEGELKDNGKSVEISETSVDYVPSHSERGAGLFFTRDPRKFKLEVRAMGFQEP
jgi:uncharacterized protein (TIGR02588 family)